ncbi:MAG: AAA family ATPase [Desertifilum sp.]|nr:AAA family ATPase [Desertifilum sp.]
MNATDEALGKKFNLKIAIEHEPPWSEEQRAILELFEALQPGENLAIGADAGTGKTTVLVALLNRIDPEIIKQRLVTVLAFNTSTVDGLKSRQRLKHFSADVGISTAHSYGFYLLRAHLAKTNGTLPELNPRKYHTIVKRAIARNYDLGKEESRQVGAFIRNLLHFAQVCYSDASDRSLAEICDHFDIEEIPHNPTNYFPVVRETLQYGLEAFLTEGVVNHDDQLWIPNALQLKPGKLRRYLFIDEAQDASPAMMGLYRLALDPDLGQAIYCGDANQALQGFSGSDAFAWERLAEIFEPVKASLSTSRRSPKRHIELAQAIVPTIRPLESAEDGVVETRLSKDLMMGVKPGDAVLSRFSAPIFSLFYALRRIGHPVRLVGKDISGMLLALLEECAEGASTTGGLAEKIERKLNFAVECAEENEESERKIEAIKDKYGALLSCVNSSDAYELSDLEREIKASFSTEIDDPENYVRLATIHAFKGQEAENVWIVGSESLPYLRKATREWQVQQEHNVLYVALTRAKKGLFLVPDRLKTETLELGGIDLPEEPPKATRAIPTFGSKLHADNPMLSPESLSDVAQMLAALEGPIDLLQVRLMFSPVVLRRAAARLKPDVKPRIIEWVSQTQQRYEQLTEEIQTDLQDYPILNPGHEVWIEVLLSDGSSQWQSEIISERSKSTYSFESGGVAARESFRAQLPPREQLRRALASANAPQVIGEGLVLLPLKEWF